MTDIQFHICDVKGCGTKFLGRVAKDAHSKKKHYPCSISGCIKSFVKSSLLEKHMKDDHSSVKEKERCSENAIPEKEDNRNNNGDYLDKYVQTLNQSKVSQYTCAVDGCCKIFESWEDLSVHAVTNHPEPSSEIPETSSHSQIVQERGVSISKVLEMEIKEDFMLSKNTEKLPEDKNEQHTVHDKKTENPPKDNSTSEEKTVNSNQPTQLKFTCSFDGCGKSFSRKDCKTLHEYLIHAPRVKCPIQGCKEMVKEKLLSSHIQKNHSDANKCFKCRKVIDQKYFKKHSVSCKGKFQC